MEGVLSDYGYNGATFPKKQVIVTETNIPRKQKGDHIGSERAQLNYLMKAYIRGQIENIRAIYVYALSDGVQKEGTKYHPFVHMGLSKTFIGREPRDYEPNSLGIAFRTMSMLLDGWTYDSEETKRLKLDSKKTDGGAFRSEKGEFMYVLWAKTSTDLVEDASYTYHFPSLMDIDSLYVRRWNYSSTRKTVWIKSENIVLSSSPSFFTVKSKGKTTYFPNPVEDWLNIPNKEAGQLVEMLTMDGRKVLEKITEKPKDVVNCSRLASGTYIVRLDGVNVRRVQKK